MKLILAASVASVLARPIAAMTFCGADTLSSNSDEGAVLSMLSGARYWQNREARLGVRVGELHKAQSGK